MTYSDKAIAMGKSLAQIRINHTQFQEVLAGVGRIIQLGNSLHEPVGMTMIAPPGAGKSLVIECVQKNICEWSFLRSDSVLVASLKEEPTVAQIQGDLLEKFNYAISPRSSKQTNAAIYNVLVNAIAQHDIRLIALDEYQHVFLSQKHEVRSSINDWLKRLMTQTGVPVLLSGTETLRAIERADPQLSTRISAVFTLPEFKNDEEWRGIFSAFATAASGIDLSSLVTDHSSAMFKATAGIFRTLKAIIIEAAMIAIDDNEQSLQLRHLKVSFQRVVGPGSSKTNPFV